MNIDFNSIVDKGCIPLIIAILALGLPVLLQTASRIDDKYNSIRLLKTFYRERITKLFIAINIFALISIIIWFLNIPRIVDWNENVNYIIDKSAFILIFTNTVFLIILLFKFIQLIKRYYDPLKLFKYLEKIYDKNKPYPFLEISDLLFYSIEQGNEELARELISFVTNVSIEFRINKKGEEIIYSDEYYSTIFQANELIYIKRKKTVSYLNGSIFLTLYIDSYQETSISDKSYNSLWIGLRQALFYDRDDVIMSYWKNAHQHFGFFLNSVAPVYNTEDSKPVILNEIEISKREKERSKYLEYHFVLGGLLIYLNRIKLLKNILFYTNQTPPVYHLIPGSLSDIIDSLLKIKEDFRNPFHFEQMYSFPDIDGVNQGAIMRYWTKKYFSILFLRQYTLQEYYYGENIFSLPIIPNSLSEMKKWEKELMIFKKILTETLNDEKLLLSLELNELSDKEWHKDHNKQYPIDLLDKIISNVKLAYKEKKISQPVSTQKEDEFYCKTKEILSKSISKFSVIENNNDFEDNFIKYSLRGTCELIDKTAFSDDQDISYLNTDTIVATTLSANLELRITSTFLTFMNNRYLFKPENIFEAINKIGFDFKNYTIISFGVHLKYFSDTININNLEEKDDKFYFNNSEIINIESYIDPNLINSIIIVNKNDLPKIIYKELSEEENIKYQPKQLDKSNYLYAKIIDLNTNDTIRETITTTNIEDLKKKVLACILINWEIKWKKSTQIYQFKVFEQFRNSGKPNSFDDLKILKSKDK